MSCILYERVLLLFLPKHDMFKAYLNILLATQEQRKWYLTSRLRLSVLDLGLRRRELCLRLLVHNGADRCSAGGVETQCLPFYIHSYSRLATFSTVWVWYLIPSCNETTSMASDDRDSSLTTHLQLRWHGVQFKWLSDQGGTNRWSTVVVGGEDTWTMVNTCGCWMGWDKWWITMTTWIAGDLWLMAVTGGGEVSHVVM